METITVKITGTTPLMMHSDRLANPLAPETVTHKALTSKRKKTDDDHLAIAKSEFLAGLYWTAEDGIHIPGYCMDATLKSGAKLQRMGTHWARGALVLEERIVLQHDGPTVPEKLWEDRRHVDVRGVKVGTAKVMRYRPIFRKWCAEFTVMVNTDVLNVAEAKKAIEDAGALIGLLECRPRMGRFEVAYG